MTVSSIPMLFALYTVFCFGYYVYSRNPKTLENRAMLMASVLASALAFIELCFNLSEEGSVESALWRRAMSFWPLMMASLTYYFVLFSEHELIHSKRFNLLFLCTAIGLSVGYYLSEASASPSDPQRVRWLMGMLRVDTLLGRLGYAFLVCSWVVIFLSAYRMYQESDREPYTGRANLIFYSCGAPVVYFLLSGLNHFFGPWVEFATPLSPIVTVTIGCVSIAVWRFGRYPLSPIAVADNIVNSMYDGLMLINNNRIIESNNTASTRILSYTSSDFRTMQVKSVFDKTAMVPEWVHGVDMYFPGDQPIYHDSRVRTKAGRRVPVSISSAPLTDKGGRRVGYLLVLRDIEEENRQEQELKVFRKKLESLVDNRADELSKELVRLDTEIDDRVSAERVREGLEEERSTVEEALYHAQKMESIGRLAGGVAHDFNNILFVINTYSDSFLKNKKMEHPRYNDFQEIYRASTRATSLTQQLLAFSKKQIATPKLIDPCAAVRDLYKMLSRLVGEGIQFVIISGEQVGRIMIDPGQFDQMMVNLAVNARDAMPAGGKIKLVLSWITLTRADCRERDGLVPGDYVRIEFSDTGIGMDGPTLERIFDPFFTTKAPGKGTGLGLSTIYGIVKQNQGFLEVTTRVGVGTTFRFYLPREQLESYRDSLPPGLAALRGSETILLVEDDIQVRRLASRLLGQLGYRVIEASGAGEAMLAFHRYRFPIDLLFTDIVMPGMSGRQLSSMLHKTYPNLKVLFMSGYNEEIAIGAEKANGRRGFLAKPFSFDELSSKVREVLDA